MTEEAFLDYVEAAVPAYAQENIASGRWPAEGALERARADIGSLLPLGPETPDHHLLEIVAGVDGPVVGVVWLSIHRAHGGCTAFVYDLAVKPEHRRQGHANRAMRELEKLALAAGATSIGLNVFAHNHGAQRLYQQLGFTPTNFNMRKPLG
jgi:ribosomal protein S18 acetylase RimI-like enzyme